MFGRHCFFIFCTRLGLSCQYSPLGFLIFKTSCADFSVRKSGFFCFSSSDFALFREVRYFSIFLGFLFFWKLHCKSILLFSRRCLRQHIPRRIDHAQHPLVVRQGILDLVEQRRKENHQDHLLAEQVHLW